MQQQRPIPPPPPYPPPSKRQRVDSNAVQSYQKRNYKNTIPRTMSSTGIGFPKKMLMTHKYVNTSSFSIPAMATTMQKFQFSCNGLYDPNTTGGGHQPLYFDQMTALYNHYHVIGSSITVTINLPQDDMFCAIYVDDDTTILPSNIDLVAEQTQAKRATYLATATTPLQLSYKWSARKYFGSGIMANNELRGNASSNPTEQSYYTICVQSSVIPASGYNLNFQVEIRYITIWNELREIASS